MSRSADKADKRWAIAPPPSPNSTAISGEFLVDKGTRRAQVKSAERAIPADRVANSSFVQELEPSDSDRETEAPATVSDPGRSLETIPAPEVDA